MRKGSWRLVDSVVDYEITCSFIGGTIRKMPKGLSIVSKPNRHQLWVADPGRFLIAPTKKRFATVMKTMDSRWFRFHRYLCHSFLGEILSGGAPSTSRAIIALSST